MLWFLWRRKPAFAVAAVACAGLFTGLDVYAVTLPGVDSFWISPRVVQAAKAVDACPNRLLISTPFHEPSLVFLNGPAHTYLAENPIDAADTLAKAGACGVAVVGAKQQPDFLARAAALRLPLKPAGVVEGRDYADNKKLQLTLYTAAASSP